MFKEHFRTQKQICLHQSRFSLFNKIQNLEIEKICLELLFDNCAFSLNCHNGGNKGGQIHYRTFLLEYKGSCVLPLS